MSRIFISYRRADSADAAGRIFDRLEDRFGRDALFLDSDSIPLGADFRERIQQALDGSAVALVVIGDGWLGPRLADTADPVRIEVEAALERGLPIIPVLVGHAVLPDEAALPGSIAALVTRQAAEVRAGARFDADMGRLIDALDGFVEKRRRPQEEPGGVELPFTFAKVIRDPSLLCGQQLGAYTVESVLAAGGSGIAYLARHPRLGQQLCVKISLPVLSDMESIRRSVARGIRGIVKLDHRYVVKILEFDTLHLLDDRSFFVAMEYVRGAPVDEWSRALPPGEDARRARLRLAYLMASTLGDAHECRYTDETGFELVGVLHGDVKPGNVIVRPNGDPAINDFMMIDIQRALDPAYKAETTGPMTDQLTEAFGTPGFMAPEQAEQGIVTVGTDVYGLGCTLVTLFHPGSFRKFAEQMAGGGTPLDRFLLRMLSADPSQRPDGMRTVAHEIARIAEAEGLAGPEMAPSIQPDAPRPWWQRILGR